MPIIYLVGAIKNMMVGGSRLNTESFCLRLQLFSAWTSPLLYSMQYFIYKTFHIEMFLHFRLI